jgi:NitT/TauT family transport system permease protein
MPGRSRTTLSSAVEPVEPVEPGHAAPTSTDDISDAALEQVSSGLDALDVPHHTRTPWWRTALRTLVPPLVAVVLFVLVWQILWAMAIWPEYQLPAPKAVYDEFAELVASGDAWSILWVSVHRALIGFAFAIVIGVPLGLLIGTVKVVRAAIGPLVSGLMTLPSVAWVPAAILWFGIEPATMYAVILLGSVPSIAMGLVSGLDQIPTILPRVGKVLGAKGLTMSRHILLPASLPGFIAGLKQGWAFSWRSLMAAELIANSPQLGVGLGQFLQRGKELNSMAGVLTAIFLILIVGVLVDLLIFRPIERRVLAARGLTGVNG